LSSRPQSLAQLAHSSLFVLYAPLLILLAAVLSVALQGFDYPGNNNIFHIPIVLDYANSIEGPSDVFYHSLSRYVSGFWIGISYLASESNIYYLFLTVHVAIRVFTIFLVWRIVRALGCDGAPAALFCCFLAFLPTFLGDSPVGRNEILIGYLTHSQAVTLPILLSWLLLLKRRFLWAAAMAGLAFDINAFVGAWGGLATGIVMLSCLRGERVVVLLATTVKMLGVFVVVASPVLLWILEATRSVSPHDAFDFRDFLREYFPHHHMIDTHIGAAASLLLAMPIGFLAARHVGARWSADHRRIIVALFATYCAVIVGGMILPYVTDSRLLLNLYPLRMDSYFMFLLGLIIISWCAKSFKEDDEAERAYALIAWSSLMTGNICMLLVALILAGDKPSKSRMLATYLPFALFAMAAASHMASGEAPLLASQIGTRASVIGLIVQGGVSAYFLRNQPNYFARTFLFVAVASTAVVPAFGDIETGLTVLLVYGVLLVSLLLLKAQPPQSPTMARLALFLPLVAGLAVAALLWGALGSAVVAALMVPLVLMPFVPFLKRLVGSYRALNAGVLAMMYITALAYGATAMGLRGSLSSKPERSKALAEAQHWARNNTPPHTVFLPVGVDGFSTLSRRPVWIDWKIGAMVHWAPETHELWSSRWQRLKEVRSIRAAEELARTEGVPFIVFDRKTVPLDHTADACVAFENAEYWVMRLCDIERGGLEEVGAPGRF